ncbi:MAG: DUF3034 family protein [Phycisphaerae bacterium]
MKKIFVLVLIVFSFGTSLIYAGVPLNNLEGVGGIAFNPLAYTAGTPIGEPNQNRKFTLDDVFTSKPQIGTWYVNLKQSKIDWSTVSIAQTFFRRLELSYGYENVSISGLQDVQKHNFGAKLLVLEEKEYTPAVSAGTIFKHTTYDAAGDSTDFDYYIVATKLIKKTFPKPVLISGGILSTKGKILGVLGFDDERDEVLFGNIDVLPLDNVAVGVEYREGAKFSDFKNADYWDAHIAWFVNKNFSLVAAYVVTGNRGSSAATGLGDGVVLSAQYAF